MFESQMNPTDSEKKPQLRINNYHYHYQRQYRVTKSTNFKESQPTTPMYKNLNVLPKLQKTRFVKKDSVTYANHSMNIQEANLTSLLPARKPSSQTFQQHAQLQLRTRSKQDNTQPNKHFCINKKGKRAYNEDRFSCMTHDVLSQFSRINLNTSRSGYFDFYAVFDGHGGSACSEYLKENTYTLLLRSKLIDTDPEKALIETFLKLEEEFLAICQARHGLETSGSCAVVCLVYEDKIITANLGDCRALLFNPEGLTELTKDHKPYDTHQKMRIIRCGGKIYKEQDRTSKHIKIFRQTRVLPGNLNISRTIGDIEVKVKKYGGLPGMISAEPEVEVVPRQGQQCLLLASDGLFEAFSNHQVFERYKKKLQETQNKPFEEVAKKFTTELMEEAEKKSGDNITIVTVLLI